MASLVFRQERLGPMENFVYLIGDRDTGEAAVVDPGWEAPRIRSLAEEEGCRVTRILLTHGHPDHCGAVAELQETVGDPPVILSRHEAPFYRPPCRNLTLVDDGETLSIGGIAIRCLHTPGHTPGGQCFLCGSILLTGDTLFIDGCGRCDLPGGDARVLHRSLHEVLARLPDDTEIYPGHAYGPRDHAPLGEQKRTNPYLACPDEETFLKVRMGLS